MTPHDHSVHVPGCFRCEMSLDELEPPRPFAGLSPATLRQCLREKDLTASTREALELELDRRVPPPHHTRPCRAVVSL